MGDTTGRRGRKALPHWLGITEDYFSAPTRREIKVDLLVSKNSLSVFLPICGDGGWGWVEHL